MCGPKGPPAPAPPAVPRCSYKATENLSHPGPIDFYFPNAPEINSFELNSSSRDRVRRAKLTIYLYTYILHIHKPAPWLALSETLL